MVLRQADRAGMDFFGFKVLNQATLDELDGKLKAYGVVTERIPADEMLETGERVRFKIPTGHTIEPVSYTHLDVYKRQEYEGIKIHDWSKFEDPFRLTMDAYWKYHCLLYTSRCV